MSNSNEYIECPYCAETIKANAIKCKYCKSDLKKDSSITKSALSLYTSKEVIEKHPSLPLSLTKNGYNIIKDISQDMWYPDLPFEMLGYKLLKNTSDQSVNLMINFCNVSLKTIRSLYIQVSCFDDAGDPVAVDGNNIIEVAFMDLNTKPKQIFGGNVPIKLTGPSVRNVDIIYQKVVYADDYVQRFDQNLKPIEIPYLKPISNLPSHILEVYEKLKIDHNHIEFPDIYIPKKHNETIWNCCCGRLNKTINNNCTRCGREMDAQFKLINESYLENKYKFLVEEYEKKMVEREEHQAEKKEKVTKIIVTIIVSIVIISLASWGITMAMTSNKYNRAIDMLNNGDPITAKALFVELGDYKDSNNMLLECDYAYSDLALSNEQYEQAISGFTKLSKQDDYKDSQDRLLESYYLFGKSLMNKDLHREAVDAFSECLSYADAEDLYREQNYRLAKKIYTERNIESYNENGIIELLEESLVLLNEAKGFSDSTVFAETIKSELNEIRYKEGVALYEQFLLVEAREAFLSIDNYRTYKDVNDYLSSKYYQIEGRWGSEFLKSYDIYRLEEGGKVTEINTFLSIDPYIVKDVRYMWTYKWTTDGILERSLTYIRIINADEDQLTYIKGSLSNNNVQSIDRLSKDTSYESIDGITYNADQVQIN